MKPQPLIAVRDVRTSSRFYQSLLGCQSGHGGAAYERLVDLEGRIILQLHHWEAHEHPHIGDPAKPVGNGVLLWFEVKEFDAAVDRARELSATILEGPKVNPNAKHRELWLHDLDGYAVVLAGPRGDV